MSNDRDRHLHRHSAGPTPLSQDSCPTEVLPAVAPVPTRRSLLSAAGAPRTGGASTPFATPFAGWRGQAPTEELPAVSSDTGRHGSAAKRASSRRPTVARHLRAAAAGILIAAALLTALSGYAAQGISSARQAALQSARPSAPVRAYSTPSQTEGAAPMSDRASAAHSDVRSDIQPDWVTETTHAAYDRTDPTSSPLDLPRCTTSPDTPLPCLATISPDSRRAVVLEEDASLTAVVRR